MTVRVALRWVMRAGTAVVCGLVVYAGVQKILDPAAFRTALTSHKLVGSQLLGPLVTGVPCAEVLVGAWAATLLANDNRCRRASLILACTFAVFALYATALVVAPPPKPTGCGCAIRHAPVQSWARPALENAAICGALLLCGRFDPRDTMTRRKASRRSEIDEHSVESASA